MNNTTSPIAPNFTVVDASCRLSHRAVKCSALQAYLADTDSLTGKPRRATLDKMAMSGRVGYLQFLTIDRYYVGMVTTRGTITDAKTHNGITMVTINGQQVNVDGLVLAE